MFLLDEMYKAGPEGITTINFRASALALASFTCEGPA